MKQLRKCLMGVPEAACIGIVVLIPLVFNPLSLERFERDKQALFRSLALLILAARTILLLLELPRKRSWRLPNFPIPVAATLAALTLAVCLSTAFSVSPGVSIWGSYANLQGLYTFLCGLVVAVTVAALLRRCEQIELLQTATIVAGFPVAVYAILQRAGLDPFGSTAFFSGDMVRAQSTLGNPIHLGGYLVMIIPMGCQRLFEMMREFHLTATRNPPIFFNIALYTVIIATQVVALLLTVSRGPFLGLLVAFYFLFILLALYRDRRRAAFMMAGLGAMMVVGLLLVGSSGNALKKGGNNSIGGRLALSLSPAASSGRGELWAQAPGLIRSEKPFRFPDGKADPYRALRRWFGYGPETLVGVLPQYFEYPGPAPVLETHFHNLIWDAWAGTGGVGVCAILGVYLSLFFTSYLHLGWIRTRLDMARYWILQPLLGGIGAVALAYWRGEAFAGLGLQAGLVGATLLYPMVFRAAPLSGYGSAGDAERTKTMIIALVAALAGHLVETAFAFETATTTALFWVYLGLLMGATAGKKSTSTTNDWTEEALRPGVIELSTGNQRYLGLSMIAAMTLVPLLFAFVSVYSEYPLTTGGVLGQMLLGIRAGQRVAFPVLLLLLLVWVASAWALVASVNSFGARRPRTRQYLACWAVSGLVSAAYSVVKAAETAAIGTFPRPGDSESQLLLQCKGFEMCYVVWMLFVLGLVMVCAFFLRQRTDPDHGPLSGFGALVGLSVAGAAAFAIVRLNVDLVRADMDLRWATVTQGRQVGAAAVAVLARAVKLAPREAYYRAMWSQSLHDLGAESPDPAIFESLMKRSEQALLDEEHIMPLSRADYVLGTLYLDWALREQNPKEKDILAQNGRRALERARIFEPGLESTWVESANLELLLMDKTAGEAFEKTADKLIPSGSEGEFGFAYAGRSFSANIPSLKELYAERAGTLLDLAIRKGCDDLNVFFGWLMARGQLFRNANEWEEALACFEAAAQTSGAKLAWQADVRAAEVCWKLNRRTAAIGHVQSAIRRAPPDQRPMLILLMHGMQTPR